MLNWRCCVEAAYTIQRSHYLFYFEEMPVKEIAKVTEQKTNTVKTRLRRAKSILKDQLGGEL